MLNISIITTVAIEPSSVSYRRVWLKNEWKVYWYGPTDICDRYAECGPNGICDSGQLPICKCLRGFQPKSELAWSLQDASDGCRRQTSLDCVADGFLMVSGVKLPSTLSATIDKNASVSECRDNCLRNCSCTAYEFLPGARVCISWAGYLIGTRYLAQGTGEDFYLRLAASELSTGSHKQIPVIVIVTPAIALFLLGPLMWLVWIRKQRHIGMRNKSIRQLLSTLGNNLPRKFKESNKGSSFSLFHFSTIVAATNNFSDVNQLGQGGFGLVYKGNLTNGQEIAVKILAVHSGQGVEEFKNEILLISKLQHTNLVQLLGCCIHGEEKILIYEYMPNKSLDFYLFEPTTGEELDWTRPFHIIEAIAQGLLYLHQHSRLRIIHRDLKASNILLDSDMNTKISDFGIAKIFGSNETHEHTKRVIGTYGYMSPEYLAGGLFSVKSDVFSFGVVLLEIISGKKNNRVYQYDNPKNLLGHAWLLWKDDKPLDLVDPSIADISHMEEISRCIHVGLLCVQESYADRPNISEAITMLSIESAMLPDPKLPVFFNVGISVDSSLPLNNLGVFSPNELSATAIRGR